MIFEKFKNIIDGIVENEIRHIANEEEVMFSNKDSDYIEQCNKTKSILDNLNRHLTEEEKYLLNNLIDSIGEEMIILNKFYFQKGLSSGLTNLNFLKEINCIDYFL